MELDHVSEPPAKRRRLSNDLFHAESPNVLAATTSAAPAVPKNIGEAEKQYEVGISEFVNTNIAPFTAILKKRYTDFLVNEILPDGSVVHLRNTKAPKMKAPTSQPESNEDPKPREDQTNAPATVVEPAQKSDSKQNGSSEGLPDVTETDRQKLVEYFNDTAVTELLELYDAIKANPVRKPTGIVRTEFTSDRSVRSEIHENIRRIFKHSIDSATDHDGVLVLTAAKMTNAGKQGNRKNGPQFKNQRQGKLGWADRGGEYLHFTLTKENKDTMEVVSWLTRQLHCNPKNFQFAGTKDRRAVTTQRCSAYRVEAERLEAQNRTLRGSKVGDFEYHQRGLELGDLSGNEFVITLRDVQDLTGASNLDIVSLRIGMQNRMRSLRDNGYLNYYGLQRFGTFSVRTDVIGRDILREDFHAACDAILTYAESTAEAAKEESDSKIGQDDRNRALSIQKWRQDGRANAALDILPRKFSAEAQLIRHLSKHPNDHFGALMNIQRNLRLMYVHAYQSLVWNLAASNRLKLYGNKVVRGDLVLVQEHKEKELDAKEDKDMIMDADGEEIIVPANHDRAAQEDEVFERARALTAAEANSGLYTIFDIVLPQPGYDIVYPENGSGAFYKTFMSSADGGKLDPYNMRRKQREFSLSGAYRKLLARIGEHFEVTVHQYKNDDEQFVQTDMDLINQSKDRKNHAGPESVEKEENHGQVEEGNSEEKGDKLAAVLKFQLGSSQYATMVLRELSRDGIGQHKPDFGGGR